MSLKVNFLINRPSMSGGARVIARYARMLKDRGHDVRITGFGAPPVSLAQKTKRLLGAAPAWSEPQSHFRLEGLDLRLIHGRATINADDIPDGDVIVASYWEAADRMFALPASKGAKVYFVQHHEAEFPHADRTRAEKGYRQDARIIVVSGWLRDIMATRYGRNDAILVLNAVDTNMFSPTAPRRKQSRPTIGFLGSRNATKRVDIAVRACELLRDQFPNLRVRVLAAGDPAGTYAMHDWFEPTFNPPQAELAGVYSDCDAWLFTSDIEGYGLPLLEALACGTPLVARPAGAAPDLVTPLNGELVDSDDPAAIAAAAARILSLGDDGWKRMSDAAIATAARHDWSASFAEFEAALIDAAR